MKNIFGLILGSFIGCLILGYFTKGFSVEGFSMFTMGIVLGYLIGRHILKERTE